MNKDIELVPWMDDNEIEFLLSLLKPTDVMLEWGCGGSTLCFSKAVKEYYSIEHNEEWYKKISDHLKENENIFMYHIPTDIPRKLKFGPSSYHEFVTYINHVDFIDKKFDKVLIDGRARQWCAEKVKNYLNDDAIVFLHDFGKPDRERYNSVLNHYIVINKVGTLVALKKKDKQ